MKGAQQEAPGPWENVAVMKAPEAGDRSEGLRVLGEAGRLRALVLSSSRGSLEVFVIHYDFAGCISCWGYG